MTADNTPTPGEPMIIKAQADQVMTDALPVLTRCEIGVGMAYNNDGAQPAAMLRMLIAYPGATEICTLDLAVDRELTEFLAKAFAAAVTLFDKA